VSGANQADEELLRAPAGEPVRRADADLVRRATGFAIGGVPPYGHPAPLETLVDEDLLGYDEVWATAGTPRSVFPLTPGELLERSGGSVRRVSPAS